MNERKHILYVEQFDPRFTMGGIETFIASLSNYSSKTYDVDFLWAQKNPGLRLPKSLLAPYLLANLYRKKCDLVHSNWWTSSACVPFCRQKKIPLLATMHGTSFGILKGPMGKKVGPFNKLIIQESKMLERFGARGSDIVIAVSGAVKEEIVSGYGVAESKVKVKAQNMAAMLGRLIPISAELLIMTRHLP